MVCQLWLKPRIDFLRFRLDKILYGIFGQSVRREPEKTSGSLVVLGIDGRDDRGLAAYFLLPVEEPANTFFAAAVPLPLYHLPILSGMRV